MMRLLKLGKDPVMGLVLGSLEMGQVAVGEALRPLFCPDGMRAMTG